MGKQRHWGEYQKKKDTRSQKIAKIIFVFIFVSIFWTVASCDKSSTSSTHSTPPVTPTVSLEQEKANRVNAALNDVRAYVNFLTAEEQFYKTTNAGSVDMEKLRKTLVTIESLSKSLHAAQQVQADMSKQDKTYLKGIETRLSKFQTKVFPGLRKSFAKNAGQMLWGRDVYVSASGKGSTVLDLSAGIFAANANIKAAQEQIIETVTRLRFKRVQYRWYKDADQFTYYKVETAGDGKIISTP